MIAFSSFPILAASATLAFLTFTCTTAAAQDDGHLKDLLQQAVQATMQGQCPSSIMSPVLVSTCEDQQPGMGKSIAGLGAITALEYKGIQQSQMGPAEVYKVRQERGSMTWMISSGQDGKILVLWTPGPGH